MEEQSNIDNRYAFFDLDGTIYKGSTTDDALNYLYDLKLIDPVYYDEYFSLSKLFLDQTITYKEAVEKAMTVTIASLKNFRVDQLEILLFDFFSKNHQIRPYVFDIIKYLKQNNFSIYIISAGVYPAVKAISDIIKADYIFYSESEISGNVYTGEVIKILHSEEKKLIVENILNKIDGEKLIVSFGDTTGDLGMLEISDIGIVVNPKQNEMMIKSIELNWLISDNSEEMIDIIDEYLK